MKGAPKNFEPWLKIKPFNKDFRLYKKKNYDPIGNLPRCDWWVVQNLIFAKPNKDYAWLN